MDTVCANILLEKTIEICASAIDNDCEALKGISRPEFKELWSLLKTESLTF